MLSVGKSPYCPPRPAPLRPCPLPSLCVSKIRYTITPSVFAQAAVIFTIFHLYTYLGMALYGGVVTPAADFGVRAPTHEKTIYIYTE